MAISDRSIRNIVVYVLPKFGTYGINLLILPVMTRLIRPEDYGVVAMAMVAPSLAVNLVTMNLASAAQRFYFEYRHDHRLGALYATVQVFFAIIAVPAMAAVWYLSPWLSKVTLGDGRFALAVFATFAYLYANELLNFYLLMLQNLEKAASHGAVTLVRSGLAAVLGLAIVWFAHLSYMGVIYGQVIGTAAALVLAAVIFNREARTTPSWAVLREGLLYGLQITPKAFTSFVNRFFDKYMLNRMLSLAAVGVYNIGQTVTNSLFLVANTLWSALQPSVYREAFDGGEEAAKPVGRMFTVFAYAGVVPMLLVALFAEEAVWLIAPASYYGAIDPLTVLAIGVCTHLAGMFVSVQFAYAKRAIWILPITVVGTLANVGLNVLLVPRFGVLGAAVSSTLSVLVSNAGFMLVGQRLYKVGYEWGNVAAILLAVTIGGVGVIALRSAGAHLVVRELFKLAVLGAFVGVGSRAKLLSRENGRRIWRALTSRGAA